MKYAAVVESLGLAEQIERQISYLPITASPEAENLWSMLQTAVNGSCCVDDILKILKAIADFYGREHPEIQRALLRSAARLRASRYP